MAKSKRNAASKLGRIETFKLKTFEPKMPGAPVMPPVEPDPDIRRQDMQQTSAGG